MAPSCQSTSFGVAEDFKAALARLERRDFRRRSYVSSDDLRQHLSIDQISGYLRDLWKQEMHPTPPIRAQKISYSHIKTFAILLFIGRGKLILHFVHAYTAPDGLLPLAQDQLIEEFAKAKVTDSDQCGKEFFDAQSKFLTDPLVLRNITTRKLAHILPFCYRSQINRKSGRAALLKVLVPESLVDQDLQDEVRHSRTEFKQEGCESCFVYQFALKQFLPHHENDYLKEVKAFEAFEGHDGMIKHLANFEQETLIEDLTELQRADLEAAGDLAHSGSKYVTTYNILLEFGQQDLDVYFENLEPPSLPPETIKFWEEMLNVLRTVEKIHHWTPDNNPYSFQGLHADIKPDNLLWVLKDAGIAKLLLADFGLAKFQRATPHLAKAAGMKPEGFTHTYAPPEAFSSDSAKHTQMIDIWSLGCVFSIAASWVIGGPSFVKSFSHLRRKAMTQLGKVACDSFHDGTEVLKEIADWHSEIKIHVRPSDRITTHVLVMVNECMLRGPLEERHTVTSLLRQFEKIIERATQIDNQHRIPPLIKQCLLEVNESAEKMSSMLPSSLPQALSGQFSKDHQKNATHKQTTKPVSNRTTSLKDLGNPGIRERQSKNLYPIVEATPSSPSTVPLEPGLTSPSSVGGTHQPFDSLASHATTLPSRKNRSTHRRNYSERNGVAQMKDENVFQALREMQEAMSRSSSIPKSDPYLKDYFTDRDIKFVVDNASSMGPFWDEAAWVLEAIAWKCRDLDKDGMDLSFTRGSSKANGVKTGMSKFEKLMPTLDKSLHTSDFWKKMCRDVIRPNSDSGGTNMESCLGDLFAKYIANQIWRTNPRKLTIVILTDGRWEESDPSYGGKLVYQKIAGFVREIQQSRVLQQQERPVSIQFIQFGDDKKATEVLEYLDDFWPPDGPDGRSRDIVDCVRSNGNIYKMILGSLSAFHDNSDFDEKHRHEREEDATSGNRISRAF